jgi:glycosyltransferase involved in cell wall biosynthesis
MKFVICDPNLERASGHHWFLDTSIASEAASRGISVTLLTHRSFTQQQAGPAKVIPAFSHTCYARKSRDPVTGEFDDFRHFNDVLYEDLAALPQELFDVDTLVLFPTVTQKHLYGAVRWMKDFPAAQAPTFVVYLMLPSGIELTNLHSDQYSVIDPLAALHYRLAFDVAKGPGPRVHFFGTGLSHAREFSLLANQQIDSHPVVLSGMSDLAHTPHPADAPRTALLFMGDAKEDKGFLHLPELVQQLAIQHPDWQFLIHANCNHIWGESKTAHQTLKELAQTLENFEFQDAFISSEEYAGLLSRADLVVTPYSPEEYWRKSSGVAWEAIWCGLPSVVPEKTWLDLEIQLWGSDGERFEAWTPASIEAAINRLIARLDAATATAQLAAKAFQRRNSLRLLINQLSDVWMQRMALGSIAKVSPVVVIPLDKAGQRGWHHPEMFEGRQVRWSGQQIVIQTDLDPDSSWRFTFEGNSFMGEDQVTQATLTAEGRRVQISGNVLPYGESPRWRIQGVIGPAQSPTAATRLVLTLPYARRPAGSDTRELGLLFGAPLRFVRSMEGGSRVVVDHPPIEFTPEQVTRTVDQAEVGYIVRQWASASVSVDPTQALDLVAEVDSAVPVQSLFCMVNGVAATQQISTLSPSRTRVVWHVPASALKPSGGRAGLIFVNSDPTPEGITLYGPYATAARAPSVSPVPLPAPVKSVKPLDLNLPLVSQLPKLPEDGVIRFTGSDARLFMKDGWSYDEPDHVWMLGRQASLAMTLGTPNNKNIQITLNLLTLADIEARGGRLSVQVNGHVIGDLQPEKRRRDYTLALAPELLSPCGDALITLISDMSAKPPGEARDLAMSFYSITVRFVDTEISGQAPVTAS